MAENSELQDSGKEERRANALNFIRHRTAFVYSAADLSNLLALDSDGLSGPATPANETGESGA